MNSDYLRRTCFLSLFVYLYGEPRGITRFIKTSLIQFTDYELPLDFEKSIGYQIQTFLKNTEYNKGKMNEYYNALFRSVANDDFFDTLYLEINLQNKLGGECYVFRRNSEKYIIFRGSDTPIDVWIDITIESTPLIIDNILNDKSIRIHKGFLDQLKNYNFINQITKIIDNSTNIHIVGHSLGAASGLLQGYYLHHALKSEDIDISIVSVGGPVVGTSTWVNAFNRIFCSGNKHRKFIRLINDNDIIPNLHKVAFDVLNTIPLLSQILPNIDPPKNKNDYRLEKYFNKYTYDYQHVGFETWIIQNITPLNIYNGTSLSFAKGVPQDVKWKPLPINQLKGMEDCSVSNVHRYKVTRVLNEKHKFHKPDFFDVINIADNHMIEYQYWLSSK